MPEIPEMSPLNVKIGIIMGPPPEYECSILGLEAEGIPYLWAENEHPPGMTTQTLPVTLVDTRYYEIVRREDPESV